MIRVDARQLDLSRRDLQRRAGARGEFATVEERLLRVNKIMRSRLLVVWRRLLWWAEQSRRQAELQHRLHPSDLTHAMLRTADALDEALVDADALMTEAWAEIDGAQRHLDEAIGSLRIDLHYADLYKLGEAGLDEAQLDAVLNGEGAPGIAS